MPGLHLVLFIAGCLLGLVLLGVLGLALWYRLRIGPVLQRMFADDLGPRSTFPTAVVARARLLRSVFVRGIFTVEFAPAAQVSEIGVTDREIVLERGGQLQSIIPLSRLVDASLVGEFMGVAATDTEALLRLVWRVADERVTTVFVIAEGRPKAERVRREIHLRMPKERPIPTFPAPGGGHLSV